MIKKILSLFTLIFLLSSFIFGATSCGEEENTPPSISNCEHIDSNGDGKCDICEKETENKTPGNTEQPTTPEKPQEPNNPQLPVTHTHTLSKVAARIASCDDNGNIEYYICLGCDKIFSDFSEKNEITLNQTILPSTGHIMVENHCAKCDYYYTLGLTYSLNADNASYSVTGIGTATDLNIIIPTIYNSLPVTAIDTNAFYKCTKITGITISENITQIGDFAFLGCSSLSEIHFNATNMNDLDKYNLVFGYAGEGANGIKVTIGKNVTRIPAYLFCPWPYYDDPRSAKIASVELEKGNACKYMGEYAFAFCESIEGVYINDIAEWCNISFYGANSSPLAYAKKLYLNNSLVTELAIPGNIEKINSYSFYGCEDLVALTVLDGVKSIGSGAFLDCKNLANVSIPDSITDIASNAFSNCSSLTYNEYSDGYYFGNNINPYVVLIDLKNKNLISYTIHNDAKVINHSAFENCTALENVSLPNKLVSIGRNAFKGCSALSNITIPNSVEIISSDVFDSCKILTIYCESAFKRWEWNSNWNSEKSPVVWDCKNNDVADDGNIYTVVNGVRYALKNGNATVTVQNKNTATANISSVVTYKNTNYNVTQIASEAFYSSKITSIIIPETVVSIGNHAFVWCDNLSDVYYTGSEQNWVKISIGVINTSLTKAKVHFNYSAK